MSKKQDSVLSVRDFNEGVDNLYNDRVKPAFIGPRSGPCKSLLEYNKLGFDKTEEYLEVKFLTACDLLVELRKRFDKLEAEYPEMRRLLKKLVAKRRSESQNPEHFNVQLSEQLNTS